MPRSLRVAALLFVSGTCALVYQIVWMRELRLVFGASTPATGAVAAVFMAGLGIGSFLLGRRADAIRRPLLMYAWLEAGIAVTAAASPFLLDGVRSLYVALGGSVTMGMGLGTVVRLVLSALVLLPPTVMMGGTLPAAARAATGAEDVARRSTALLYGLNTLGAVAGATLSTFVLIEIFGIRLTLWMACVVNGIVAIVARVVDRHLAAQDEAAPPVEVPAALTSTMESPTEERALAEESRALTPFLLTAAGAVGFAFFLMELVWYRVLSPLLGGSSYTYGLILAIALFGIGLGGLIYARRRGRREPELGGFALSCVVEALLIALPFALGDRVALLALFLRDMGILGLWGHVIAWTIVTSIVVLPAAIVAGYQFPLLIALLGRARSDLGRHVGIAYAANTLGAIFGSLAGGFFIFTELGAIGSWKLTTWVLVILGAVAMWLHLSLAGSRRQILLPALVAATTLVFLHGSTGPTAVWRHSPIGAGRAEDYLEDGTRNGLVAAMFDRRRGITWEADGRESTVGLYTLNDTAFLVNGKSDGSAILDAGTQVMGGVLGALLQPQPVRRALVIGLGTGSTAGWLASLDSVERVDVVELEPAILHVARVCSAVNQGVIDNPKVNVILGDAREVLLTTPEKYDLVFSEPSNPYRAGVASLFTRELYAAVFDRLEPGGVFVQWLQAYEIDAWSVRTVYATLNSVFPSVESWRTKYSDLVLMARETDVPFDVARVQARMAEPGYREALLSAWRATDVADVVAHFVAQPSLSRAIFREVPPEGINTDDRNLLEFSIARALGRPQDFSVEGLLSLAAGRGEAQPKLSEGSAIDWEAVFDAMVAVRIAEHVSPDPPSHLTQSTGSEHRTAALAAWSRDQHDAVVRHWKAQSREPRKPIELMVLADAHAVLGHEAEAVALAEKLRAFSPTEADVVHARLRWAKRETRASWAALRAALIAYRDDPWASSRLLQRGLALVEPIASRNRDLVPEMVEVLRVDFAVSSLRYAREDLLLDLGLLTDDAALCVEAVERMGPFAGWSKYALERRVRCYELARHPDLARALNDLEDFKENAGSDFGASLRLDVPVPPPLLPGETPP